MKTVCCLLLLAGMLDGGRVAAQEASEGGLPPAVIVVEPRGDTLIYRAVGRRGRIEDASGRRYRLHPVKNFTGPRHAVSLEIGAYPLSGSLTLFPGMRCYDDEVSYPPDASGPEQKVHTGPLRRSGAFGTCYAYRAKRWLEIGITFTYAGFKRNSLRKSDGGVAARWRKRDLTLMPFVRFSWLNRRSMRLYSGLQFGCQWCREEDSRFGYLDYGLFAAQFTWLGISVGRRFFGYAELGTGMRGIFVGGLGYRFGAGK